MGGGERCARRWGRWVQAGVAEDGSGGWRELPLAAGVRDAGIKQPRLTNISTFDSTHQRHQTQPVSRSGENKIA